MECLVLYTGVTPPRDDTDHYCCIAAAGLGVVRDDFWHEDWEPDDHHTPIPSSELGAANPPENKLSSQ